VTNAPHFIETFPRYGQHSFCLGENIVQELMQLLGGRATEIGVGANWWVQQPPRQLGGNLAMVVFKAIRVKGLVENGRFCEDSTSIFFVWVRDLGHGGWCLEFDCRLWNSSPRGYRIYSFQILMWPMSGSKYTCAANLLDAK